MTDDSSKDSNTAAIASDVPLMRYAEVLLNYAEAKAELGEMNENVWNKTIKPLRERSGVTSVYPSEADPYMVEYFQKRVTDPFILEVRRERGIELTMESIRFDDIIRWHQGELFARPWMGLWIPATETPLDLNNDGTPDTMVTNDVRKTSTLNLRLGSRTQTVKRHIRQHTACHRVAAQLARLQICQAGSGDSDPGKSESVAEPWMGKSV